MKALKITIEGTIELIELDTANTLQSLYDHIDCRCVTTIEPVDGMSILGTRFPDVNITGWGDDEGLFVAEPEVNFTAMVLFGYPPHHPLVGVWLITSHDDEGETIQLPDDVLALAGTDAIDLIDFAPGRGPTAG